MTDIPPPRYRIVERKGRIVVTDTWADGGRPGRPVMPVTPVQPVPKSLAGLRSGLGSGRSPGRGSPREPGRVTRMRAALVRFACLGAVDDAGRNVLTTHNHFDEKGPRSIALSDAGVARLGSALLVVAGVAAALFALFLVWDYAALIALFVVGLGLTSVNTTARPALTRWFDTLGDDSRR